ncbi:MAG: DivIVA domain-containing protein [Acidimicrobiales bacterium]|nr:DivIVA domain-containing protein [Acidimicrobiales bacterium]
MPEERRMTITSSPLLSPDDVAGHSFTLVRRGFDPREVRAYLESLAHGLAGLADREQDLLEDLAAAERRAENPVLDEATLVTALGQQTARVLQSAHEVADELTTAARDEADHVRTEATQRAESVVHAAESRASERLASAEEEANRLLDEAGARASALLEAAGAEREELRTRVKDECRAMIEEAQQLRARVLADLSRRRRMLHAQIEQLRAGRERLAETIDSVRHSFDEIADDLSTAEDSAREAAESAARALAERAEEEPLDELGLELQQATIGVEGDGPDGAPTGAGAASTEDPEVAVAVGKVDALFAKLRADQESSRNDRSAEGPGEVTAQPASADVDDNTESVAVGVLTVVEEPTDDAVVEPVTQADVRDEGDVPPQAEAQAEAEAEDDPDDGPPADRPPEVLQRDELIAPMVTMLSRRLKRTLQDTQNDLLDQLRSNRSQWSPAILPDETEQLDGFTTAVLPVLEEAAEAGVTFAEGKGVPATDELIVVAHGLAEEVVNPLRRRLAADDGVTEAGEAGAAEHVGAAFREWRGTRVERLAGDYVVAAFSLGSVTAVGQRNGDGQLEWISVPGSGDAPCPDCEDNGLSGPQPPGESFPTGHRHPPAHSGCRCLVAPAAP